MSTRRQDLADALAAAIAGFWASHAGEQTRDYLHEIPLVVIFGLTLRLKHWWIDPLLPQELPWVANISLAVDLAGYLCAGLLLVKRPWRVLRGRAAL